MPDRYPNLEQQKINYRDFLSIRCDGSSESPRGTWTFTVAENFTIYTTSSSHGHKFLYDNFGIDRDTVLTEGYIDFDDSGNIQKVHCKSRFAANEAFKGSAEQYGKFVRSVEQVIREKLKK